MSARRSDIKGYIAERTKGRADWPSDRYVAVRIASRAAAQFEQLREQQQLTYEALARRAGTSKAQVIRLLSGTYDGMTTKSMAKVAAALGCEIEIRVRPAGHPSGRSPASSGVPARAIAEAESAYMARSAIRRANGVRRDWRATPISSRRRAKP